MDANSFIAKWKASTLKERSGSQEHFIDLCRLLGQPTPAEADSEGSWYTFEKGASKQDGGGGFADVWKQGCFAWEYKGKHKDLKKAYEQLLQYREDLENPPLLIVSDMETIEIHTNFTGTVKDVHKIALDDLLDPAVIQKLKWIFSEPKRFEPAVTVEQITQEVASKFSELAATLRERKHDPQAVAHFLSKLLFCLFAEDVGLLPEELFTKLIKKTLDAPERFTALLKSLFRAMCDGGDFGVETIPWFNGGLFDDDTVLPLTKADLKIIMEAAKKDWGQVEPSIFGTLFERGLDPNKRSQLGAHYTPRSDMERVIDPVITRPLRQEWDAIRTKAQALVDKAHQAVEEAVRIREEAQNLKGATLSDEKKFKDKLAKLKSAETKARNQAGQMVTDFLEKRLRQVTVLDPACGSGNFLYVALERLHDLEKECLIFRAQTSKMGDAGIQLSVDIQVGPQQLFGLEINPYAHELAQVTVWIGHLQWMMQNGFSFAMNPVLRKLDNIQCRDAILDLSDPDSPMRAMWPKVDFIVGNPPFLGDKKMISEIGETYVNTLRKTYAGDVPGQADLVCYWFEQARAYLGTNPDLRAGFVATNSIRGGKNRVVLDHIKQEGDIFHAWSDEPWVVDGAAVRISLVCFGSKFVPDARMLDAQVVEGIYTDLTANSHDKSVNLTEAVTLQENIHTAFIGTQKTGPFDIDGEFARKCLTLPRNPNGKLNTDVIFRSANGNEVTKRVSDRWIVRFPDNLSEMDASLYEAPFEFIRHSVKPFRDTSRQEKNRRYWWLFERSRPEMYKAIKGFERYIATSMVAKHRLFVWFHHAIIPENLVVAIARDDDTSFGILHSKLHELWSLRLCTWLGKGNDPRYTPTTTFATFPFPQGLTPNIAAVDYANDPRAMAIAEAARRLNELRENWLNPPDLVVRVPEVVEGYPDRILPKDAAAATQLKQRTLTNLYNQRPQWLLNAHRELDEAVAMAYGWEPAILEDENEILARLFELNQARASEKTPLKSTNKVTC